MNASIAMIVGVSITVGIFGIAIHIYYTNSDFVTVALIYFGYLYYRKRVKVISIDASPISNAQARKPSDFISTKSPLKTLDTSGTDTPSVLTYVFEINKLLY